MKKNHPLSLKTTGSLSCFDIQQQGSAGVVAQEYRAAAALPEMTGWITRLMGRSQLAVTPVLRDPTHLWDTAHM